MNYQQTSRINRVYSQTFYLIDKSKVNDNDNDNDSKFNFVVSGSTANLYTVTLDLKEPNLKKLLWCNCPDMRSHAQASGVKCKHCCFVLLKVLKLDRIFLNPINWDDNGPEYLQKLRDTCNNLTIDSGLTNDQYRQKYDLIMSTKISKNKSNNKNDTTTINTKTDSDPIVNRYKVTKEFDDDLECPICFDGVTAEDSFQCPKCTNLVHKDCMKKWLSTGHKNCVYCRSNWSDLKQQTKKSKINLDAYSYDNLA
tara:strand:- start:368 stop:1126 length:759 start_codon:yes stop_codon:yes gene_type:complete